MLCNENGFTLTRAELRALVAHACTDFTRPHINAVAFESKRGRAFATDGHRLAVCSASGTRDAPTFLLSLEACEQILRATKATYEVQILFESVSSVRVTVIDAKRHRQMATLVVVALGADLKPPPIDQVIPTVACKGDASTSFIGVNAHYLADLALVASAVDGSDGAIVVQAPATELEPLLFRARGWTVVIMPTRMVDDRQAAAKAA